MSQGQARVADSALTSLDELVGSTLQILRACQAAGNDAEALTPSFSSSESAADKSAESLGGATDRQARALQQLRLQIEQLSVPTGTQTHGASKQHFLLVGLPTVVLPEITDRLRRL